MFFKELCSLDRGEWLNILTGAGIALLVDATLWLCGVLIDAGEGNLPSFYWVAASILGSIFTLALIGGAVWGSIDSMRCRTQPTPREQRTIRFLIR